MSTVSRFISTILATVCAATVGLVLASAPALAASHAFSSSFGGAGTGAGQFNDPYGVAVNETSHRVYVVDKGNNRVQYFSGAGVYEGEFDGSGAPATFSKPTFVAVNQSTGDVWVTDAGHKVVDEFSATGVYAGHQITGLAEPTGVAVEPGTGDVWVGDGEISPNLIQRYTSAGAPVSGAEGSFNPEYEPLGSLAVDSNGVVYSATPQSMTVTSYKYDATTKEWNRQETFSEKGSGPTHIMPGAVAVDPTTHDAYIAYPQGEFAEEYGGEVRVWETGGVTGHVELEKFGAGDFYPSEPNEIRGIAEDPSTGTVYVANPGANDVNIFAEPVAVQPAYKTCVKTAKNETVEWKEGTPPHEKTKTKEVYTGKYENKECTVKDTTDVYRSKGSNPGPEGKYELEAFTPFYFEAKDGKKEEVEAGVFGTVDKTTVLSFSNGDSVTCKKLVTQGRIESATEASETMTLEKCETAEEPFTTYNSKGEPKTKEYKVPCTTGSEASGTIKTEPLTGKLTAEGGKVYERLEGASSLAAFTCQSTREGSSPTTFSVGGSLRAEVEPFNTGAKDEVIAFDPSEHSLTATIGGTGGYTGGLESAQTQKVVYAGDEAEKEAEKEALKGRLLYIELP